MSDSPQTLKSKSADDTRKLGLRLGALLRDGDFVALEGQLGAGKTLFAKAVAQGCGISPDDVSSPTFSIVQTYQGKRGATAQTLHHADLYRLTSYADLVATGFFDLEPGATLVEWTDNVPGSVPAEALILTLEVTGDDTRTITATAQGERHRALLAAWLLALDQT